MITTLGSLKVTNTTHCLTVDGEEPAQKNTEKCHPEEGEEALCFSVVKLEGEHSARHRLIQLQWGEVSWSQRCIMVA